MGWAARRRFLILLIIGIVIAAFLSTLFVATLYKAPSCTDGVQNQAEDGIDCGGPCAYLCIVQQQPPTVLFTKAISNGSGRIDVIAEIENKNASAAAKDVSYSITLYGVDHTLVQKVTGTLDLPPLASVPVFFPGIASGKQSVVGAFLDIEPSSVHWFQLLRDSRILPTVSNITQGGTTDVPRIEAVLMNPSVTLMTNIQAIVIVRNSKGDAIAASSTIVPAILAQSKATATFTWNTAFSEVPAALEVIPVIPLP